MLNYWNNFDQLLLNCFDSITSPKCSLPVIPVIQQRPQHYNVPSTTLSSRLPFKGESAQTNWLDGRLKSRFDNPLVSLRRSSAITLFYFVSGEPISGASRFRPSAVAAFAARRGATPIQWPVPGIARPAPGLRPRLLAAAAPRLNGSPGRSPGDYQLLKSPAPSLPGGSYESETIRNRPSRRDLGIPSRLTSTPWWPFVVLRVSSWITLFLLFQAGRGYRAGRQPTGSA